MKATCKVVKVVVSDDGQRREVVKPNLTVEAALTMRDKLDAKQERRDLRDGSRGGIVSYLVEGTV